MKQLVYILAVLVLVCCGSGKKSIQILEPPIYVEDAPGQEFAPDRLIIMYDEAVGKDPLVKAIQAYPAEILYDYKLVPGMAIKLPEGSDLKEAIRYFKQVKGVVSVERDRIYHLTDPVRPKLEVK